MFIFNVELLEELQNSDNADKFSEIRRRPSNFALYL